MNDVRRQWRDVIPQAHEVPGIVTLSDELKEMWQRALPYLDVRNNDGHSIYAFGLAAALCDRIPDANPEVVLPAILLHDTGWKTVPEDKLLEAIAPIPQHPELVRQHEVEGAAIARAIMTDVGSNPAIIDQVTEIIDGHDTRKFSLHINDAVVKDADKLWRISQHGLGTVREWFDLPREEALRLVSWRVHDYLFTDEAKSMAAAMGALASIDITPEREAIEGQNPW